MLNDEIEKQINLKDFPKKKIAIKRIMIKSDKKNWRRMEFKKNKNLSNKKQVTIKNGD